MDNEKILDILSGKHRNLRNIDNCIVTEWENGKYGSIKSSDENKCCLYFIENPIKAGQESQMVAAGIVAYRFMSNSDSIKDIFEEYYNLMLDKYKKRHGLDGDAWKRNLEVSFLQEHKEFETKRIKLSEALFPFIDSDEINEINSIAENYMEFLETKDAVIPCNMNEEKNVESVIKWISPSNLRLYFENWRNGVKGSICQENCIYRFVEMTHNNHVLDDVKTKFKDNPIVAVGIVAYWLMFKKNLSHIAKVFTEYNEYPEDMKELFDNYTKERFEKFKEKNHDNPETWEWDWEYEFYTKYIIPQETKFNKLSEALFDYITDSDITLIKSVMNNYIKYLKSHQAQYKHEEHDVNTKEIIRDETGIKQNVTDIKDVLNEIKKEPYLWDDSLDRIFDERVKPQEIFKALKDAIPDTKLNGRPQHYVSFRILKILRYIKYDTTSKDYLRWINLHFNCGWSNDNDLKFRMISKKEYDKLHPSKWKNINTKSDINESYYNYAIFLKNVFTQTLENGKEVDDSDSFEHLKDRHRFLSHAYHVEGERYVVKAENYINNGK